MKTGRWLYGDSIRGRVQILRRDVWPGDARLEDGEEVWDDREIPCFEVIYESPVDGEFCDSGPHFATLDEAVAGAEELFGTRLTWEHE